MEHCGVDFICPINDICKNAGGATLSPVTALPTYTELPAVCFYIGMTPLKNCFFISILQWSCYRVGTLSMD